MKITEGRIREIIEEELKLASTDVSLQKEAMQHQLQKIALQAAMLHDDVAGKDTISSWTTKKVNSLAEDIDDVFYNFQRHKKESFKKKDS